MTFKITWQKTHNLFKLVRKDYPYIWIHLILNALSTAIIPFLSLWCSAQILNAVIVSDFHAAWVYAAFIAAGTLLFGVIRSISEDKIRTCGETVNNSLNRQINDKAYVMEYDNYESQKSLDRIRMTRDRQQGAGGADEIIETILPAFLTSLIEMFIGLYFMIHLLVIVLTRTSFMDVSLWALILLFGLNVFTGICTSHASQKSYEEMQRKNVRGNSICGYVLTEAIDQKNKPDLMIYPFIYVFRKYMDPSFTDIDAFPRYGLKHGRISSLMAIVSSAFACSAYLFTGLRAMNGSIEIGDVLLYAGAFQTLAAEIISLISSYDGIAFRVDFLDEFSEFINAPSMHYEGTLPVEKRNDNDYEIEFRNVSFAYPGSRNDVLHHVNLKFKVGEKLALVGRNGAGKTTIVKLLCRLYEPTEGEILLNGINIDKYDYSEYTSIFAPVFQDFEIFSLSVKDNVAASLDQNKERIWQALDAVNMKERIMKMQNGLDTLLYHSNGEGVDISGGEAQKLAIARAWYKDAPFIILDEPTAALDPISEAEVYENFNQLIQGKTAIYISHRMSSCKFCDHIIVLQNGEITEEGSHEELLKENGEYAALFHAQAAYYQK